MDSHIPAFSSTSPVYTTLSPLNFMMSHQVAIFATIAALTGLSQAVDCYDSPSNWYYEFAYDVCWVARNEVCGEGKLDLWWGHTHGTGSVNNEICWMRWRTSSTSASTPRTCLAVPEPQRRGLDSECPLPSPDQAQLVNFWGVLRSGR
ncbi:hypothetical protein F4780DRAFT_571334 [Xylariomycetidae sp. FL0641]|nr:hypothetical protein F4780DRAFT_571334 [Xylariomycetidae sp. FL0641]